MFCQRGLPVKGKWVWFVSTGDVLLVDEWYLHYCRVLAIHHRAFMTITFPFS